MATLSAWHKEHVSSWISLVGVYVAIGHVSDRWWTWASISRCYHVRHWWWSSQIASTCVDVFGFFQGPQPLGVCSLCLDFLTHLSMSGCYAMPFIVSNRLHELALKNLASLFLSVFFRVHITMPCLQASLRMARLFFILMIRSSLVMAKFTWPSLYSTIKANFQQKFKMGLGPLCYSWVLRPPISPYGYMLSQQKYIANFISRVCQMVQLLILLYNLMKNWHLSNLTQVSLYLTQLDTTSLLVLFLPQYLKPYYCIYGSYGHPICSSSYSTH